ncbi:MAG: hypothetical protein AAF487_02570 [Bacteroidota bacterium]
MKLLSLTTLLFLFACICQNDHLKVESSAAPNAQEDSLNSKAFDLQNHLNNYQNLKNRIAEQKDSLIANDFAKEQFSILLYDSIFPYWHGTAWDFNGISEKPRDGEIACGYFVSTTLRDLGFNINRYRIAQKASSEIVNSFCEKKYTRTFRKRKDVLQFLNGLEDGEICIVGLSYHVGFVCKKNESTRFVHSTFVGPSCVIDEAADSSSVFENSDIYVIGRLNASDYSMKKWLQ